MIHVQNLYPVIFPETEMLGLRITEVRGLVKDVFQLFQQVEDRDCVSDPLRPQMEVRRLQGLGEFKQFQLWKESMFHVLGK